MNKHTPGPWKSIGGCCTIVTEDINGWEIADLRTDVPNFTANATLIAAAPDLLAALEYILMEIGETKTSDRITVDQGRNVTKRCMTAIYRATGVKP